LEESNIEITNLNEELEQEVIALRQEVALNKQYNQEKSKQESKIIDGSNQVTDNFSIKTEQSTVSDVDSESEVDRLRASLQDLQQALSSQTKKHKAQFNSAEKKAKAKLLSSEQKIESLVAEIDNLNTKLSSQTADVEAERDSHGTILSEIEEKFRTRLAKLEEENHSLEQSLEQLSEDKQLLEEALNKTVLEKNSLEKSMDQRIRDVMDETSGEATTKEVQLVELRDQCSDLQSSLSASEAKYIELKEKFASFTEKTKIQVKKFIESQKAAEEEKRQVAATLEARESEVTSLRLKLETVDHSLSDRKALSSELAERYLLY
jgi:chromosome segregation ATPase